MKKFEFIAIGNELLDGRVTDTNSVRLGRLLAERGTTFQHRCTVIDDIEDIGRAIAGSLERGAEVVVVSGGLGPTSDDLSAAAFAHYMGVPLVRDEKFAKQLKQRFENNGYRFTDNQLQQADRPEGAVLLDNALGTAPGFSVAIGGCQFIVVPGVPKEFDGMLSSALLDTLAASTDTRVTLHLRTFGVGEGEADSRLAPIHERWPDVELGFRAHFPELHIKVAAAQRNRAQAEAAYAFVQEAMGDAVFTLKKDESLPEVLIACLKAQGKTLASAESCTGGLVGHLLTQIPGASAVYLGGMVTYHNQTKIDWLDVPEKLLKEHGAVSKEVAEAMAESARLKAGACIGVATSGIAGPGGGTEEKPVGTIYISTSIAETPQGKSQVWSRCLHLPYSRDWNQYSSAYAVLARVVREFTSSKAASSNSPSFTE